jgi:hypothetical protein
VLFHTSEGDINDIEKFICKCEYILTLDKGSGSYTEYDLGDNYANAIMDKPELLDYAMGHCHSHNSMRSFFSGTDEEELTDNAPNYNYYLSLIVNNAGEYVAKIAYVGDVKGNKVTYKGKDGTLYEYHLEDKQMVFAHEMEVVKEEIEVDDFFSKQVTEICKPKAVANTYVHPYSNQLPLAGSEDWTPKRAPTTFDIEATMCLKKILGVSGENKSLPAIIRVWEKAHEESKNKTFFQLQSCFMDFDQTYELYKTIEPKFTSIGIGEIIERMMDVIKDDYIQFKVSDLIQDELEWAISFHMNVPRKHERK